MTVIDKNAQIVIYQTADGKTALEVNLRQETVWLQQNQIAELFGTKRPAITKHLRNIFISGELEENSVCSILEHTAKDGKVYQTKCYSLDAIMSVGYRVNSRRATQFRIWATDVLKKHIINGFTVNEKRLRDKNFSGIKELEKAVALFKSTINKKQLTMGEAEGLLKIITDYAESWILLNKYDTNTLDIKHPSKPKSQLEYAEAVEAIAELKKNLMNKKEASALFGNEREKGLESILANIEQSFGGADVYPSIEEKAAHLLYFAIKNHPFTDGNKRIAAFLFLLYLSRNNYLLNKNGDRKFNNNALVALALLIAESNPKDKETMIKLVMNLIHG
jgi:prophage maintenance system killer protein